MNRFGMGELTVAQMTDAYYNSDLDDETGEALPRPFRRPAILTQAYLHYWDKGMRVPADIAARLIEEGYDFEAQVGIVRWV